MVPPRLPGGTTSGPRVFQRGRAVSTPERLASHSILQWRRAVSGAQRYLRHFLPLDLLLIVISLTEPQRRWVKALQNPYAVLSFEQDADDGVQVVVCEQLKDSEVEKEPK